jgi:hypothetical protein
MRSVTAANPLALFLICFACTGCTHRSSAQNPLSPTTPVPLPVATGDYPAYGHAADYSWVAGRLMRSLKGGGCTYVVFSLRPGAPWGGRLALAPGDDRLAALRDGDMVVALGDFDPLPGGCGSVAYRAKSVQEH